MYQKDKELGYKVHQHLTELKIESPVDFMFEGINCDVKYPQNMAISVSNLERIMHDFIRFFGLDLKDPSIQETPHRLAKMYTTELFTGLDYDNFPKCTTFPKIADEMVLERGITVHSICEHHFIPFIGKAAIAYIPNDKAVGLSKLNRVVDFFSRRPQVQERLTAQVAHALECVLGTPDVAVVIQAEHLCVKLRGAQDHDSDTVTSMLRGKFLSVPALRNEFLQLAKVG